MIRNPSHDILHLKPGERAVIFHFDDLGMFQATVDAYSDLLEAGLVRSASVMVPCPWFPEVVDRFRGDSRADLGVHLTLTSEWNSFRWRPISTSAKKSGLLDREGFFPKTVSELHQQLVPRAAKRELIAQMEQFSSRGFHPSHADTHMGAVQHSSLIPAYIDVLKSFQVLGLLLNLSAPDWIGRGLPSRAAKGAEKIVQRAAKQGIPLIDFFISLPSTDTNETYQTRFERTKTAICSLPSGLTHFALHPCKDSPEIHALGCDLSCRTFEYEIFQSEALRQLVRDEGIKVVSYKDLLLGYQKSVRAQALQ